MNPLIILQYVRAILKQIVNRIGLIIACASVVSFIVLAIGMLYKPKYETSVTIFADNQNVIKPLLEGQTAVTLPKNERIRIVQEIMFSPRILQQVVRSSFDPSRFGTDDLMESATKNLRDDISISAPADNYIKITYDNADPEVSYAVVNKITSLFIEESAQNKRSESKSAYTFIDEQVKSYKSQLVEAENKLKAFEADNVDGVESQVNSSIARLQSLIDETSVDIEAGEVRISALEAQIASESRYVTSDYSARVYRERLAQLEQQLETLKLNYRDEHPDVVDLKLQIQDLKRTIVEVENSNQKKSNQGGSDDLTGEKLNPIYEELSNQLADAKVNVQAMKHRLAANQRRLEEQYKRRQRVAANQAELSELTRDYDVTKNIYEDLLERKERARISMTLDLAGQGVTYKILEPAAFPTVPAGLSFMYFAIAGPIIGLIIPLGIMVAWVVLDPTIRFSEQLNEIYPGIVLAVLPPAKKAKRSWKKIGLSTAGVVATYAIATISFQLI